MEVQQAAVDLSEPGPRPGVPPALSGLTAPDSGNSSELFTERLIKSWARALDLPPEAVVALREAPEFKHLDTFFEMGRNLRLVGGAIEFAVDESGRFVRYLLSNSADCALANATRERLVESLIEAIPDESLSAALYDYDRIPRDLSRVSENRLRKEVMRAIRDELFPATVSAMLGHLGSPAGRGDTGFDISCLRNAHGTEGTIIEQVQVKILRDDSPLLHPESSKGFRQFWKLAARLLPGADSGSVSKLLILDQGVHPDRLDQLRSRFTEFGVDPAHIIVLGQDDLQSCGFQIKEVRSAEGNLYPLRIRLDLQQFMRAACATEFLGREGSMFAAPDTALLEKVFTAVYDAETAQHLAASVAARGPIERQLLDSYGVWPLKSRLEARRVFPLRRAA